jgi:hypothetical protein
MKNKVLLKAVTVLTILSSVSVQIISTDLTPASASESLLIAQAGESLHSVALRWARQDASRPDLVEVGQTMSVENYALVNWTYGEMGGQVLLKKEDGQWKVVTGSGGSLQNAEYLMKLGVPSGIAKTLEDGPDI